MPQPWTWTPDCPVGRGSCEWRGCGDLEYGQRWEWWHVQKAVEESAARLLAWVTWRQDRVPLLDQDARCRKVRGLSAWLWGEGSAGVRGQEMGMLGLAPPGGRGGRGRAPPLPAPGNAPPPKLFKDREAEGGVGALRGRSWGSDSHTGLQ